MKPFQKTAIVLLAGAVMAAPAFAVEGTPSTLPEPKETMDWQFDGNVGIRSNYVTTGNSLSDKNPSAYFNLRATNKWFFAEVSMNTMQSQFFKRFQAEWVPAVGLTHDIGDLNLYATYRLYRYTGGTLFTGDRASSWNFDEVAIGASWKGLYGEIAYVARTKGDSKDTLFQVGYAHSFGKLTLDGQVNVLRYDEASVTRFQNFQLKASYDVGRGFEPYIGYSIGGKDVYNDSVDNQFFVGVQYNF